MGVDWVHSLGNSLGLLQVGKREREKRQIHTILIYKGINAIESTQWIIVITNGDVIHCTPAMKFHCSSTSLHQVFV